MLINAPLPCFLTGGWRCWILTGSGACGRGLGLAVRLLPKSVLVTPGLTLTYGPCLPLSVYPACHNPYYYAWLFLVFSFPYSSLDDFKLFSAVFLKGFNFSFPAVIRIQSVAFRPTHFWPFRTICFCISVFIALDTFCFCIPNDSAISDWLC